MNFWQQLKKPIFALAPMEDVTDCAFREIFAKYGKPDVMFTEFLNVDGLLHPEGFKRLKIDLSYTENQRPIVAQIWGRDPEKFLKAAALLKEMGFDGVDINFGCPQDKEIAQKTCAALIREPKLAGEIILATGEGAEGLPVSVKTRLGYSVPEEMEEWVSHLLKFKLVAIAIHARTKQEKSKTPAHWGKIKEAVAVRNYELRSMNPELRTLIIGNGDIHSREEGLRRVRETGCDGVMVARGAFGNPWIFREQGVDGHGVNLQAIKANEYYPSVKEKLQVMLEHARLYEKLFVGVKPFVIMRKNFKAYASGFEHAPALRAKLMETKNLEEVEKITAEFLKGV